MNSRFLFILFFIFLFAAEIQARIIRVEIDSRTPVLSGRSFGRHGDYELLKGRIFYGLDPGNPYNQRITDLAFAPRNADGLVEAWGNFAVLQPADPGKGRGLAVVEVSNRGGKFSPSYFNRASKTKELDPDDPDYWGDGLIMNLGLTLIWVGWEFDVPEADHLLRLNVPVAVGPDNAPIKGWVRSDYLPWFFARDEIEAEAVASETLMP